MNPPPPASPEPGVATAEAGALPWVSILAIVACVGIYLGLAVEDDYESWETLARFGYLPAESIWNGAYWPLFTSVFVHFGLWHVAFNVYWLWVLGKRLEPALGSLRFLAFFIVAGWVSSSFQLAFSGTTGIGASGVIYAFFGFMWPSRHRFPAFAAVLDARTIQIFVLWLVACVVATRLKVWEVGNAAHVSGLVFGAAVAWAFVRPIARWQMMAGLATLVALSMVPLFWCPWSVPWLSHKAYQFHAEGRLDEALDHYTRVIDADPSNAWAYFNRSLVHDGLGKAEAAREDLNTAREIDPAIEEMP